LSEGRAAHDSVAEARALTWLGLVAWRQGDYREARRLGEEALALKRRLALQTDLFKSYNALGLLAWNEGRLADATELFGRASAAAAAARDLKGVASASGNLALVQTELGEFDEARRGFDSMRVAGAALGDARVEGNALTNLGMLAVRVGDPAGALELLETARHRYRTIGYAAGEQNALGQMGTAYAALGQPHQALAALDSALDLSRRQGLRQDEASDLEELADLYRDAGDPQRALDLFAQAEPINRELGLVVESASDLRSQAEIQAELGALDAARARADSALAIHRAAGARFEELTDLLLLSDLEARAGDERKAADQVAGARALAERLGIRRARGQVAIAQAQLADRAGRPSAVLRALRGARADLTDGGYGMEQEGLALELRALARLGRLDSAASVGRTAIAAVERVRGNLSSGMLRTSYLAGRRSVYRDLVEVLRRLGRTEEAFEVADAARSRALGEILASARESEAQAGRPLASAREGDQLLRTINALTEQLHQAQADLTDAGDSIAQAKVAFLQNRLSRARGRYEELAIRLTELRLPGATLLGIGALHADAVLSSLTSDEALIEYQLTADSLLMFVGHPGHLITLATPLPPGGLEPRVRLARELIATRGSPGQRALPVLRALDDLLIGPARRSGALVGIRRLVIIPVGSLVYLPFAALQDGQTGAYLMEHFSIITLPSASALVALRNSIDLAPSAPAAVLAPDPTALPATAMEAGAVARALPEVEVLTGRQASESRLRAALRRGGVLHLATHAELNARSPMFSWLATAPGDGRDAADDGRLEVHEILGLSVRSQLVFLSGCETGLGYAWSTAFASGEDYATLGQAFLYAGARGVLATLWRVDDAGAAALAEHFYRHLGAGPAEALVLAQRASLADPRYGAPYYWAGYTLAGDGRTGWGANGSRISVR
jgi:CHAT domain-containing protein/tetratricopeptide (TPR) repeat protein